MGLEISLDGLQVRLYTMHCATPPLVYKDFVHVFV